MGNLKSRIWESDDLGSSFSLHEQGGKGRPRGGEMCCQGVRRTHWLGVHATGRKAQSCTLVTSEGPIQSIIKDTGKWSRQRISGSRERVRVSSQTVKWLFGAYISSTPACPVWMRISFLASSQAQADLLPLLWKLIIWPTFSLSDVMCMSSELFLTHCGEHIFWIIGGGGEDSNIVYLWSKTRQT